jgi:hypothetical protein
VLVNIVLAKDVQVACCLLDAGDLGQIVGLHVLCPLSTSTAQHIIARGNRLKSMSLPLSRLPAYTYTQRNAVAPVQGACIINIEAYECMKNPGGKQRSG